MKAALSILLIIIGNIIFSENIELPILWLKCDMESRSGDEFWEKQDFESAETNYQGALASLEKIQKYDSKYYPEIVEFKTTFLKKRLNLCSQFNKPIETLSKDELHKLIRLQRSQMVKFIAKQKNNEIEPPKENLFLKVKALQDQVADLQFTLKEIVIRPEKQHLRQLKQILQAETNACMLVANRTVDKLEAYDENTKNFQTTIKALKLKNKNLEAKISESTNAQLVRKIEKEFDKLVLQNKKLIIENKSLTEKYSKAEDAVDELKRAKQLNLPTDTATKMRMQVYVAEIGRLNKMLDVLQASNQELRSRDTKLNELIEDALKERKSPKNSNEKTVNNLIDANRELRAELNVITTRYKQLRNKIKNEAFQKVLDQNDSIVNTLISMDTELRKSQDEIMRQKALNSIVKLGLKKDAKATIEIISKHFPSSEAEKSDK